MDGRPVARYASGTMLEVLSDRSFRHLFLAQVTALLGTGLMTVALGLMAFDLSPDRAAMILGGILTIKMVAYVGVSPIAAAVLSSLPRRAVLVSLDLVRASVALFLPFISEVWHAFVLIFLLQSASAAFTPIFQATIPQILPDEARYTRALSLSRLAYELENIASPALAALLLTIVSYHLLFGVTVFGFLIAAVFILMVRLPPTPPAAKTGIYDRTTRGIRIYLATPRLRGLLCMNFAFAAGGSMVLVNSVVLVRGVLGLGEQALALTMMAYGAGAMAAALALPRLLDQLPPRVVMRAGAMLMCAVLVLLGARVAIFGLNWTWLLAIWAVAGVGASAMMTPSGVLLRRSAHQADLPAIFAAQFALSHACWLIAYPLAGALMTGVGTVPTLLVLGGLTGLTVVLSAWVWPRHDPQVVPHDHTDLDQDHPHLADGAKHAHDYRIDDLHRHWPEKTG